MLGWCSPLLALAVCSSRDVTVREETADRALRVLVVVILLEPADSDDLRREDEDDIVDAERGGDRGGTCSAGCNSNRLLLLFIGGAPAFNDPSLPALVGSGGGLPRELVVSPAVVLLLLLLPASEAGVLATTGGALAFNEDGDSLSDLVGKGGWGAVEPVVLRGSGRDSASACLCSGNSLLIFLGETAAADEVRRHR